MQRAIRVELILAVLATLIGARVAGGATPLAKPLIVSEIDLSDTSEFVFNRTLVTYGTYNFYLTFKNNDVAIDISNANAELSAKTYADAISDPAGTNFLFQATGSITNGPSGIAVFPIEEGYLDTNAVGKVRLEFRLYNETDNSDVRTFADLYVQSAVSSGTEVPWTPPDPATNYYTRAEVDALIQYFGAENANNTWAVNTTNTFSGKIQSELYYGTDDENSYITIADTGIDLVSTSDILLDAGVTVNTGHDLTILSGDLYIGTTGSGGMWTDAGMLWTKGASSGFVLSEQGDAADYIGMDVASGLWRTFSVDVTDVDFFALSSNPVNTVDWFTEDPGTGDDPIMRIYMVAGGAGNALQFGRATAIDAVTITSLGEQILFGDTASPTMGLVDEPGEVGFLQDVEFDGKVQLDSDVRINGTVEDPDDAELLMIDSLTVSNASATVSIKATSGTYPELSMWSGTSEVLEISRTGAGLYRIEDLEGQYIEFQDDSEEEIVFYGGETGAGVYRIGDDGTAPHHFDVGDVQMDEDLTVNGSATISGSLVTLGASTDIKAQGYGMLLNALNTDGSPYFIDSGSNASDGDGVVTQAFTVTFASAPIVVASYAENAVVSSPLLVYSITTTNCVVAGDIDVSFNWIAIGAK